MSPWKPCLATLLLAATLAACGQVPATDGAPAAPVTVETTCPNASPGQIPGDPTAPRGNGGVPADFATAWVLRCRSDLRDKPGQGKWMVQIAERADSPATDLVAELRKPSDPRTAEACTTELVVPPYFVLVDARGLAIAPAVPTDTCGKPRREALAQLEKLTFRTISETPVNQVQSSKSVESGCADPWKDTITIQGKDARRTPAGPALSTPMTSLVVCVYDRITGDQLPVGNLSTSSQLDGEAAQNVLAALDKAGPAADCSAPHTRFAVLTGPKGIGGHATVELDGCHRLLRADNTLGQLDEGTVALLG